MSDNHRTVLVKCRDGCSYVGLDYWPDDDEQYEMYGEFYIGASTPGMRWRDRAKAVWTILWGREHVLQAICLDRPEAIELRDFLVASTAKETT